MSKRQTVLTFGCFSILILLTIHLYLFYVVLLNYDHHQEQLDHAQNLQHKKDTSQIISSSSKEKEEATTTIRTPLFNPIIALQPLRYPVDYEQYTIRINTWKRPEQLLLSIDHHVRCPGVAQIQVVWCDPDEEPPTELNDKYNSTGKIFVEKHFVNTLNERFNILPTTDTPTFGILSIDDDVLRPCESIDNGFFKWTQAPNRMVGFDGRTHVVDEDTDEWKYGYLSTTEKANKYSMSLTRYCFIHRNYMDMYMKDLPTEILDTVGTNFNCEDIAMSLMISSQTNGKPTLLADFWAIKSMVKLYVAKKISGGSNHKALRDECVDRFATIFQLKDGPDNKHPLQTATYMHHEKDPLLTGGDEIDAAADDYQKPDRQKDLEATVDHWRHHKDKIQDEMRKLKSYTAYTAYKQGMIENTDRWKERFGKK